MERNVVKNVTKQFVNTTNGGEFICCPVHFEKYVRNHREIQSDALTATILSLESLKTMFVTPAADTATMNRWFKYQLDEKIDAKTDTNTLLRLDLPEVAN